MGRSIVVELFVPEGQLAAADCRRIVQTLLGSGFSYELEPGQGGFYVVDPLDWYDHRSPLSEALDALENASTWAVQLQREAVSGEIIDFVLSIDRALRGSQDHFDTVGLSTQLPLLTTDPVLSQEFLAWATFLAELTRPWYGWGGSSWGLLSSEPISPATLAALEPQPIEWLNIFGPPYIQRLGLHKLLSAPAWRVEFLPAAALRSPLRHIQVLYPSRRLGQSLTISACPELTPDGLQFSLTRHSVGVQ